MISGWLTWLVRLMSLPINVFSPDGAFYFLIARIEFANELSRMCILCDRKLFYRLETRII